MDIPLITPKRVSNTCVTCRVRKVRCDGLRDVCSNCARLGFTCTYDDGNSGPGSGIGDMGAESVAVPRRRVRQACQSCHSRKAKCSGTTPKCDRCRVQGLECIYRPSKRSRISSSLGFGFSPGQFGGEMTGFEGSAGTGFGPRDEYLSDHSRSISSDHVEIARPMSPTAGANRELPAPDESLIMRTFDNYFRHIHHLPAFSFLHRASLMQRYHAGLMDRALLLSLVGITSMMTDLGPGLQDYGAKCIDLAEALILRDLEKPTALKLQALVLIIKYRIFCRRFSSAFMLLAIASRFAAALRMNLEHPKLCFLAQESRRRLMWALYMIDTGIAAGHPDFLLWSGRPDAIRIKLPCNERNFEFDHPEITEYLVPPPPLPDGSLPPLPDDIGFLALHIRIFWIRSRVLQFTKSLLGQAPGAAELAAVPGKCEELKADLDAFEARLPVSFRWTEGNVRLRTYSPRLAVYVMTHLWWRQCHCDLFRVALAGLRETLPREAIDMLDPEFVRLCRRQCYEHARAMADMFSVLLQLDKGVPVCDLDLPLCVNMCARMMNYLLLTGGDELGITAEAVGEMTNVCLRVVKQATAGPAVAAIREEIEKLIADGWKRPATPTRTGTPAPVRMLDESALDPLLSRGNRAGSPLGDEASQTAPTSAIPDPQPQISAPTPQYPSQVPRTAISVPEAVAAAPAPQTEEEGRAGAMSESALTHASNAFEGALDGMHFGMEAFGMDPMNWYPGPADWMDPDLGRM
ncbi:Chromate ion transporter [Pleurostoma richardsiae]|uniref:Chromate ion transporter n=1 Tax=Pleurostoma richardsiae TaxID=41990 RepID=A0AA38R799_9PEZI|nr:Chromate ion transporter [Pleurostoma richardsiae]